MGLYRNDQCHRVTFPKNCVHVWSGDITRWSRVSCFKVSHEPYESTSIAVVNVNVMGYARVTKYDNTRSQKERHDLTYYGC